MKQEKQRLLSRSRRWERAEVWGGVASESALGETRLKKNKIPPVGLFVELEEEQQEDSEEILMFAVDLSLHQPA